jgi:hypothetical protein
MYSYEDRIRAIELYIKLGKRVKATVRQLGYPTKNALKGWYREHERRGDLARGYHRAPKYSMAQRQAAVDHFLHHGRCIDFTRKALGYPCRSVLRSWIYERHPELCQRSVGRSRAVPRPLEVKQEAVIALCTRQGKARAIAQDLGVSRGKPCTTGRISYSAERRPETGACRQGTAGGAGPGAQLLFLPPWPNSPRGPVCRRAPHTFRNLPEESSLLRLPQDARVVATDVHLPLGEGCAAPDEAGELNRGHSKAAPVRLVSCSHSPEGR